MNASISPSPFHSTSPEIVAKVNALLHEGFEIPVDRITASATLFQDLGLDSLDAVDMLVHLEEGFKIKVNGERLMTVRTVSDIYHLVEEVAAKAEPTSTSA